MVPPGEYKECEGSGDGGQGDRKWEAVFGSPPESGNDAAGVGRLASTALFPGPALGDPALQVERRRQRRQSAQVGAEGQVFVPQATAGRAVIEVCRHPKGLPLRQAAVEVLRELWLHVLAVHGPS